MNFVDHKRTIVASFWRKKTKDEAARKLMNFVGHFERRFIVEYKCYAPTEAANTLTSICFAQEAE